MTRPAKRIIHAALRLLLATASGTALAASYSFNGPVGGPNYPACSGGSWSSSGSTVTCAGSITLASGDALSPTSARTVVANGGITLSGNNAIGSASVGVSLQTTWGNVSASNNNVSIYGNVTASSGAVTLSNTTVTGSITTNGTVTLTNSSIGGNVYGRNGVTTTSTTIGGDVTANTGAVSLNGGSVTGAVYSNCCQVSTQNTNIGNGVGSGSNTVTISGGTISGPITSSGGSGISIQNATVSSGSITATNVPITISGSTIGSAGSPITVSGNNTVTITSSSIVYGNVTAGSWPGALTVTSSSIVYGNCSPVNDNCITTVTGSCSMSSLGSNTLVTCTGSGTFKPPSGIASVRYVVVAGGGGGGGIASGAQRGAGGGGGGGVKSGTLTVTPGTTYTVTVGAGGSAGTDSTIGGTGGNSVFSTITAHGGGGGASSSGSAGATGGSGGGGQSNGSGGSGTSGEGNSGGDGSSFAGGGGGGAGAAGSDGFDLLGLYVAGGNGGNGVSDNTTGITVYYGGGGGGGTYDTLLQQAGSGGLGGGGSSSSSRAAGNAGTSNTGGGGGGATGSGSGSAYSGGAGGSGIVILRYGSAALDHVEFVHDGAALTCMSETITVQGCSSSASCANDVSNQYSGNLSITLPAISGATWCSNSSCSTTISGTQTIASGTTLYLRYTTAATISLVGGTSSGSSNANVQCYNTTTSTGPATSAAACNLAYTDAGFIFATAADGTTQTIATQTAGIGAGLHYLRAVKADQTTGACTAALSGSNSVALGYACSNPTSCSSGSYLNVTPYNGGTAQTTVALPAAGSSVTLYFDGNGNAPLAFNYLDAGRISLTASKAASGALQKALSGNSSAFVVKPYGFKLDNLTCNTADKTSTAAGAFCVAGGTFTGTVRAVRYDGAASNNLGASTPNFGHETTPQTVSFVPAALVVPTTGAGGTLDSFTSSTTGSFSGAANTATATMVWPNVGTLTLKPVMDYLGTGDLTSSGSSDSTTYAGNVGRFYPSYFALTGGTLTPACISGGFTYMDHAALGIAYTLTAHKKDGGKASNYLYAASGGYPVGTVTLVAENANAGTDLISRLSSTGTATWSGGEYIVAATAAKFARGTVPDGAYDSLLIGVKTTDVDAALQGRNMKATTTNDCTAAGDCDAMTLATATKIRYGRLRITNAFGSQSLALAMPATLEYYDNGRWLTNTNDSCTALSALNGPAMTATAIMPSGSTTGNTTPRCLSASSTCASGQACNSATPAHKVVGGSAGLCLTAPGAAGYIDIEFSPAAYLQLAAPHTSARASFGLYSNSSKGQRIIQRHEVR